MDTLDKIDWATEKKIEALRILTLKFRIFNFGQLHSYKRIFIGIFYYVLYNMPFMTIWIHWNSQPTEI